MVHGGKVQRTVEGNAAGSSQVKIFLFSQVLEKELSPNASERRRSEPISAS